MKKHHIYSLLTWNSSLVVSVLLSAFILPLFPLSWGRTPFNVVFSMIFVSGIMSLDKRKWSILFLSGMAFVLHFLAETFDWNVVSELSQGMNTLFFLLVVLSLISQMARARVVTARVIMEAISGYILLGFCFSLLVTAMFYHDPGAFNLPRDTTGVQNSVVYLSEGLYFTFVTIATLGYGDIVPLKPYSRAFTTFMAITGQLYVAIIIAMLVGKYAAGQETK
jgi:voltage-gated potassium channel Kch